MDLTGPTDGEPPTLAAYLDDWFALQSTQLHPSTWENYRGTVRRYVLPHLGGQRIDTLHPLVLTKLYVALLRGGAQDGGPLSQRTVAYVHGILHKALGDARRLGYLASNPADDAALPRIDAATTSQAVPELQTWTAAELRRFLTATADTPFGPLWAVAAGTGMRRGELLGLRWDGVDLDGRVLQVRHALSRAGRRPYLKEPKSGRSRRLRVDDHVRDALAAQADRQARDARVAGPRWDNEWNLVFTTARGRPLHPDAVSRAFREACEPAGVPTIRLHCLRHTHATLLLETGIPPKVVSERLGHASVQITLDIYAHVLPGMDADAVARFAAHVHGA